MDDGATVTEARSGSAKTSAACCEAPLAVAAIVTVVLTTPGVVVTGKVADELPAGVVSYARTAAAQGLLDVGETTASAAAVPRRYPAPVTPPPPANLPLRRH